VSVAPIYSATAELELDEQIAPGTSLRPKADPAPELLKFRHEMGTISRQSAVFFLGTIFTAGAGYLFKIYVARKLGAESLGVYALGMTVVSLLGLLAALGLPAAAPRFVAAYTATGRMDSLRAFLGRSMFLLIATGLLLGGLAVLGSHWVADRLYRTPALSSYMPMFGLLVFTSILATFCGQVLAGFKDVARRTVITNFIGVPLMMVLAVALLRMGAGLRGYVAAQVISSFITLLLLCWAVWKLMPPVARRFTTNPSRMESEVVRFSATVFGIGMLEFLLSQVDKILIGFYLDARRLGIYAVATALVAFVPIVLSTVNQIFAPMIADLHARGERQLLGRLFRTLTKWILGLTIPLAAVMVLFAPSLMRLFGSEFEAGWPILVIGTVGQLVNCAVGSVGFLLLMSGNQRRLIRVQAVMAAAIVLLDVVMIPLLGLIGAALVGSIVNVVSNLWYLAEVRQALGITPYDRSYVALLAPTLAVSFWLMVVRYVGYTHLSAFWVAAAIAGSYPVFMGGMLLFGLDSDDQIVLGGVWTRVREILWANAGGAA
jgi:O-antigen/teichoic acid export membrane protein